MNFELTYLLINIFTIIFPFFASFEKKRVKYSGNWKYLFPAIFITAAFFIVWDVWFTNIGVWAFNSQYLTGITLINLPLEEWLFFLTVPFSCVFIYEVLNYYNPKFIDEKLSSKIALGLGFVLIILAIIFGNRMYTFVTFSLTGAFLLLHAFVLKSDYLGKFFRAYIVHLVPFLIVNGILTAVPVVTYNNTENLGIRLLTIPIEDSIYSMLLLLMNITLFEAFKKLGFRFINTVEAKTSR